MHCLATARGCSLLVMSRGCSSGARHLQRSSVGSARPPFKLRDFSPDFFSAFSSERSYHQLRAGLRLGRVDGAGTEPPIYKTSAKSGLGIDELASDLLDVVDAGPRRPVLEREEFWLKRWMKAEWGQVGVRFLDEHMVDSAALLRSAGGLDGAQRALSRSLVAHLCRQER